MSDVAPTDAFIDWWFAPWRAGGPELPPACRGLLGQRDAYRDWCHKAKLAPDLPQQADWRWQQAAALPSDQLLRAATLFGGLLSARAQRQDELAVLDVEARRWCLAVASTQPLAQWTLDAAAPIERGLGEFGLRAEQALPGMWPRLALGLSANVALAGAPGRRLHERDWRCWMMCVQQAHKTMVSDS